MGACLGKAALGAPDGGPARDSRRGLPSFAALSFGGSAQARQKHRLDSTPWYNHDEQNLDADADTRAPYVPAPYAVMLDWTGRRRLPVRVLSIDGGGVRGIIPATILAYIEKKTGRRVADLFDVLVGTSVGGMLCTVLLVPDEHGRPRYSAQDTIEMCIKDAKRLFPVSILRTIATQNGLNDARYPSDGVEAVMKDYFGEYQLKHVLRDLVIPSYDIELRRTVFFKSRQARANDKFNYPLRAVCRAASASPTFFEPAAVPTKLFENDPNNELRDHLYLIDAGIYVNSPAMCAYAEVQRHDFGRVRSNNDVLLVSLGTGVETEPFPYESARRWGIVQWLRPITDIMSQASASVVNYQLSQMLEPRQYFRFNTVVQPGRSGLDDPSDDNLKYLRQVAEAMIESQRSRLDALCEDLRLQAEAEDRYRAELRRPSFVPQAEHKTTMRIHSMESSTHEGGSDSRTSLPDTELLTGAGVGAA